jgi:glycosyltransferase involved in cell wall biosynthesis
MKENAESYREIQSEELRWISSQMNRVRNGEFYRYICDTKGAFVQVYEAFGLTVVEAMSCGLPNFAPCNGDPAEIIFHGKSGFHIDPYSRLPNSFFMANMGSILILTAGCRTPC